MSSSSISIIGPDVSGGLLDRCEDDIDEDKESVTFVGGGLVNLGGRPGAGEKSEGDET